MDQRYQLTRCQERLLQVAIAWADQNTNYVISGLHVCKAAMRLANTKMIILNPLPPIPGRRSVRHFEVRPTSFGRHVWRQHQEAPCWKSRGGDTRSVRYQLARIKLLREVQEIGVYGASGYTPDNLPINALYSPR